MNKVILMGRLTRDPELKQTPQGTSVLTFSLAVDRRYVKQGEARQADFINCVAWRTTAEFIARYFNKGSMIGVCGSLQTRTYNDKDGKTVYVTEVVVEEAYFAGSKSSSNNFDNNYSNGGGFNDFNNNGGMNNFNSQPSGFGAGSSSDFNTPDFSSYGDDDDDLPF